jgi:hypothetical protein
MVLSFEPSNMTWARPQGFTAVEGEDPGVALYRERVVQAGRRTDEILYR